MSRRSFIKGVGLFGVIAAGAAGAMETANAAPIVINNDNTPKTDPNMVKLLEEQGNSHLQLSSTYGELEPPKPPPSFNGFGFNVNKGNFFIAPDGNTQSHLTIEQHGNILMGTNYKKFVPGTEKTVDVKMMPGPDGHLYVKVNDQWKRVLTSA